MNQDLAAENYMMPMGPTAYNPYWGMQPGMEGFGPPYAGHMPYMNFGVGPMDVPFGGVMPQDPFGGVMPHDPFGGQGCMMPPYPPQRYGVAFYWFCLSLMSMGHLFANL